MKTIKNSLNDNQLNDLNDMTTGVSIFNNYSSLLNNMSSGDGKESIRSLVLMTTDLINLLKTSKIGQVINNGIQSGAIGEKLWLDIKQFNEQMDKNNGNVKSSTIVDIVSGSSALISNFIGFAKLSPIGVALNMVSVLYAAVSNTMTATKYEETIHVSELDDVLVQAATTTLTAIAKNMLDFEKMLDTIIPDDLQPWSDDAIELVGTEGNDTFESLSTYFHDRPRIIFTGGGRDVLNGDDGNDFLHGGSGNDTFFGDEGNDTLIDTEGFDIYHITDHDTIYDSDGKGEIVFEGGLLKDAVPIPESFKRIAHGLWYAQDAEDRILYTATKIDNDLLITSLQDSDNRITLKDFFNLARHQNNTLSFLNIHLQQSPTPSNTPSHLDLYTNPDYVANVYTGGITPMPTDELDRLPRMYTSNKGDNIFASGK